MHNEYVAPVYVLLPYCTLMPAKNRKLTYITDRQTTTTHSKINVNIILFIKSIVTIIITNNNISNAYSIINNLLLFLRITNMCAEFVSSRENEANREAVARFRRSFSLSRPETTGWNTLQFIQINF